MGELRTKMDNDMILHGMSARTRKSYQQLLGHRSLMATARYLHVTQKRLVRSSPLDLLRLPETARH